MNPAKFEGVEDMSELGYLNEPAVLYNLQKRYEKNLIYVSLKRLFFLLKLKRPLIPIKRLTVVFSWSQSILTKISQFIPQISLIFTLVKEEMKLLLTSSLLLILLTEQC